MTKLINQEFQIDTTIIFDPLLTTFPLLSDKSYQTRFVSIHVILIVVKRESDSFNKKDREKNIYYEQNDHMSKYQHRLHRLLFHPFSFATLKPTLFGLKKKGFGLLILCNILYKKFL